MKKDPCLFKFFVTGTRTVVQHVSTTVLAPDRPSAYQMAARKLAYGDSDGIAVVFDSIVGYNVGDVSIVSEAKVQIQDGEPSEGSSPAGSTKSKE